MKRKVKKMPLNTSSILCYSKTNTGFVPRTSFKTKARKERHAFTKTPVSLPTKLKQTLTNGRSNIYELGRPREARNRRRGNNTSFRIDTRKQNEPAGVRYVQSRRPTSAEQGVGQLRARVEMKTLWDNRQYVTLRQWVSRIKCWALLNSFNFL
jgi:hypothetical protein